jgi:hypothetical protein
MACVGGNSSVRKDDVVLFDEQFQGWGSEDRDWAFRVYNSGVNMHVLERTGLVHLRYNVDWNPGKGGGHHSQAAFLENQVYLYNKYPGTTMLPSLELVKYFYLNENTHTWESRSQPRNETIEVILAEFKAWRDRHY